MPVGGIFLGSTVFSTITPLQFIARYREMKLSGNGQSFISPPVVIALGSADPDQHWAAEGAELSNAAMGLGNGQALDEVAVMIVGPSPMLANDPAVTIWASFLAAARYVGGDVSDVDSPGAADLSSGRFVALSGGVDLNSGLDNLCWGPLLPEADGVNERRAFAADHYTHIVLLYDAMIEKANLIPAPRWEEISETFVLGPTTTDKTHYREAVPVLDSACMGGRAGRFSLWRDEQGNWIVRIAIRPDASLDADNGSGRRVAAYWSRQLASIRHRAGLSPDLPLLTADPNA
jgi:hypothetical protein